MKVITSRAMLALPLALGLAACVPATTSGPATNSPAALPADVPTSDIYLATKDNGIAIPAIPPEKVPDQFKRQVVDFPSDEAPGTIIINPATKHLYFITGNNKAIRYGIAVGKAGFQWSGEALVTNRRNWPTWTPPREMIERNPSLSKWEKGQPGGPTNPLGARALYLTTNGVDYGYRIHGTPEWWSIGKNASSGCIRMINQDVMDLFERVPPNAKVIVMTAKGEMPKGLSLPPPQPKKAVAPKVEAVVTPAAAPVPQLVVPQSVNEAPVGMPPALMSPAPVAAPAAPAPETPAAAVPAPVTPPRSSLAEPVAEPNVVVLPVPAQTTP